MSPATLFLCAYFLINAGIAFHDVRGQLRHWGEFGFADGMMTVITLLLGAPIMAVVSGLAVINRYRYQRDSKAERHNYT